MQQALPSAGQSDSAEALEQPEDPMDITQDNKQPKAEEVGADITNDEQATEDTSAPEVDIANNEDKLEVQPTDRREENGKQEEKTNEDQGGEELVEGQEDDVIY